jgi:hypothetical protein
MIQIRKIAVVLFPQFVKILHRKSKHLLLFSLCLLLWNTSLGQSSTLFDSDEVLELNLRSNLKTVFKDRADNTQYHAATLQYQGETNTMNIPIKIRTRGHFRKISSNCKYPPILLNFKKSATPKGSVFEGQDKIKLVTPCQGDEYIIHEYLVYKLYNLITPKSFKVRLVKVTFQDTVKNKSSTPYYGMLIESEEDMAKRNQSTPFERIGLRPESTQKEDFLKMAIFEYMIGNTDWSIQYQQNIKLITTDSTSLPFAIPYDFDHAGIVRAPYAKPAPELQLNSTLQRRYRGYCLPEIHQIAAEFETFRGLKDDFYALYEGNPLLSSSYQSKTIKFLDQFYETINNPKKVREEFNYPCDRSGTGNVVIQGLKKQNKD